MFIYFRKFLSRLLFHLLSIGIFIIVSALTILSAYGYRIDLAKKSIVETGVLSIETNIRGINIFIDGKNTFKQTPAVLRNLPLGRHKVFLQAGEYFPQTIEIMIKKDIVTHLNDIFMIPRKLEEKKEKIKFPLENYKFSPRNTYLVNFSSDLKIFEALNITTLKKIILEVQSKTIFKWKFISDNTIAFKERKNADWTIFPIIKTSYPVFYSKETSFLSAQRKNNLQWQRISYDKSAAVFPASNYEIGIINLKTGKNKIITRYAENIENVFFIGKSKNFILITENKIRICREEGQCTAIAGKNKKTPVSYLEKEKKLVFVKENNLYVMGL